MAFIQEKKLTIDLNLKKEYKIIHFSDVHVINLNDNENEEAYLKAVKGEQAWLRVRKDFAIHFNEICNEEHMIPSTSSLDNLIQYTNKVNPDLLVMTGDIIDYNSKANMKYLTSSLKDLSYPYLICCGNHEAPNSIFDEITNNNSDFSYVDLDEFIVVSLNDSKKVFYQEQYDKLVKLTKLNKPIIISFHIPIMTSLNEKEMAKFDKYYIIDHQNCDGITKKMIDLFIENKNIKAILCGHTHGYSTSMFALDKYQYGVSSAIIGNLYNITIK